MLSRQPNAYVFCRDMLVWFRQGCVVGRAATHGRANHTFQKQRLFLSMCEACVDRMWFSCVRFSQSGDICFQAVYKEFVMFCDAVAFSLAAYDVGIHCASPNVVQHLFFMLEVGAGLLSEQASRAVTMVDGLPRACKFKLRE